MKILPLKKTYAGKTVLDLPEIELGTGRVTAVIGANGSGKSTLAKLLAGIERPDERSWKAPAVRIGYMPQKSYAFRMSTARNVALNGDDAQRRQHLLKVLQLEPLARQRAKKLSGGETAKMALARLLMGRYELLILDEPTAAMDMESTFAAEGLIAGYCKETGCAVLLITHSIRQAQRLADEVLFLHRGELAERGSAAQLLAAPAREETKSFLEFYGM
ncbi:MAG: ABC transporter ATP-binding protein [Oscillospiraceae bacterium]|nr:ABC transporter ATP-binding protein [Oscillospiraceae bacterium]